jgi:peroxiredoxin
MSSKTHLLLAVFLAALFWTTPSSAQNGVDTSFPSLQAAELEGKLPADLQGKVLLIDFWASWCAPCKASFPALSKINDEFSSRGFQVLGISVDEKKTAFDAFVARMKPSFTVLRDAKQKLAGQMKVPTMPTSYVVDRSGRIRFVHQGYHDDTDQTLRKEIAQLLEEKP